ncbi:hypothetical protein GW932_05280 [archaeon]|nr:hypothetical protein [archaeon]
MEIIGIAGKVASGKNTLSKIIESTGYENLSIKSLLSEKLMNDEKLPYFANLIDLRKRLEERFSEKYLVQLISDYKSNDKFVISDLWNQEEIKYLKRMGNFKLIWVEIGEHEMVEKNFRFNRYTKRESEIPSDLTMAQEEFKNDWTSRILNYSEFCNNEYDKKVKKLKRYADFVLKNKSEEKLLLGLNEIYKKLQ